MQSDFRNFPPPLTAVDRDATGAVAGNSRPVSSPQSAPHPDLERLVERHLRTRFRRPPSAHGRAAFERFLARWDGVTSPVLDAGCGTGESTFALARLHPDRLVVGVDRSAHRLARGLTYDDVPGNALLLRTDVVDFWRLLEDAGVRLAAHYLLYPNPWPKPAQVMRRWPAHPAFPTLLALGGRLECRSNWRVYAEEFALAVRLASRRTATVETFVPADILTPFESKYAASGHALYRVVVAPEPSPAAP